MTSKEFQGRVSGDRTALYPDGHFCCSCAQLCWTLLDPTDHQGPLSMGLSRQEYWSGLPFPLSGDLLNPETEPCLLHLLHWQAESLPLKGRESVSHSVVSNSLQPRIFQARIPEWVAIPFSR